MCIYNVYPQNRFLPVSLEIHWLSVINSLVLVVLLMAFLAIILLRIVKSDFTRWVFATPPLCALHECIA
jgi:hypothetical protein